MNYEQASRLLEQIEKTSLVELKRELLIKATEYAHIRAEYFLTDLTGKTEMEDRRKRAHNSLIDACNILSRNMRRLEEENDWRGDLGDDRKVIGDFACYVHCILGVSAR